MAKGRTTSRPAAGLLLRPSREPKWEPFAVARCGRPWAPVDVLARCLCKDDVPRRQQPHRGGLGRGAGPPSGPGCMSMYAFIPYRAVLACVGAFATNPETLARQDNPAFGSTSRTRPIVPTDQEVGGSNPSGRANKNRAPQGLPVPHRPLDLRTLGKPFAEVGLSLIEFLRAGVGDRGLLHGR
jgi:hypothetical protein